jgi:glycosyltransferase involved in cell wall biosynthesis
MLKVTIHKVTPSWSARHDEPGGIARRGEEGEAMERLRVGLFTEIYRPVVNGVVASVEALAGGLQLAGHEVFCFAPKMPGANAAESRIVRIPSLPLPARTPYRLTLPLVSRRDRKSVIERLDVVHVHSPFITGWMGLRYARRYGIPLIYTYHTQLEAYAHYIPFEANATRFAASQLTRTFANLADAVIAPTPAMAARLQALGVTVRVETVPSGIDVARFRAGRRSEEMRRWAGATPGKRLLLYVGRLAKEKSIDLVFEALVRANEPTLQLAIAGDGPLREELEHRAAELHLGDRLKFLGLVEQGRLPDLYASADAFVMPSVTETQGIVLAEALASGLFIIAADAPQNRDVLGSEGSLVPPEAGAFAAAFKAVPSEPDPHSATAARDAAERFSIERQISRTLALYESLTRPARIA